MYSNIFNQLKLTFIRERDQPKTIDQVPIIDRVPVVGYQGFRAVFRPPLKSIPK